MHSRLLSTRRRRVPHAVRTAGRSHSNSGFTLVEVVIAAVVLVLALLGAMGTLTQVMMLGESNLESAIAHQAARSMVERLQSTPFDEVFQRFNEDPSDDPDGDGTAEGMHFAVPGLDPRRDDADGFCGMVLMPATDGTELIETLEDTAFGMPRDLNGNGVVDGNDHALDKVILPIRVQVQWTGKSGNHRTEFRTILGKR